MIRRIAILASLLGLLGAAGCSKEGANSPEVFEQGALDEVGELYRSTAARLGRPPKSLKDLAVNREMFLLGYNSIEKGNVNVYWGVTPIPSDQPSDEVLAYQAAVTIKGGAVLLKNTTIKWMSADEFKAAPKPAGPSSQK